MLKDTIYYTIEEIIEEESKLKEKLRDIESRCIEQHNTLRAYMTLQINNGLEADKCNLIREHLQEIRKFVKEIQNLEERVNYVLFLIKKQENIEVIKELQEQIKNNMVNLLYKAVDMWLPQLQ